MDKFRQSKMKRIDKVDVIKYSTRSIWSIFTLNFDPLEKTLASVITYLDRSTKIEQSLCFFAKNIAGFTCLYFHKNCTLTIKNWNLIKMWFSIRDPVRI